MGVQVFCFAASYLVTLVLEISRLFLRVSVRAAIMFGFAIAGVVAHTIFLASEVQQGIPSGAPLSSWYHWFLVAAWVLAISYLTLSLRHPENAVGVFILPLILSMIGLAYLWEDRPPFPREEARHVWGAVHGFSLLAGAIIVSLGFVAGLMYLAQSWRLKHKLPPRPGFRLPTLEWLQNANEKALLISSILLAGGLLSGIVLNIIRHSGDVGGVPWTDPVVWTSGVLLLWLIAALTFNACYKPARQGRKVAYMTVASFIFLALELGIVLLAPSQHPASVKSNNRASAVISREVTTACVRNACCIEEELPPPLMLRRRHAPSDSHSRQYELVIANILPTAVRGEAS